MGRYGGMSGSLMDNWPSRPRAELERDAREQRRKEEAEKKRREKQALLVRVTGLVWCRACGCIHERRLQTDIACQQSEWYALWRERFR